MYFKTSIGMAGAVVHSNKYKAKILLSDAKKSILVSVDDDKYIYQKKDRVWIVRQGEVSKYLFNIALPVWKRIVIKFRPIERLLRTEIRAALVYKYKLYFASEGILWTYDFRKSKLNKEIHFRKGMRSPLELTAIEGLVGFGNQICFGEYFSNDKREEVRIWSKQSSKWRIAYTFSKGKIRHIHGLRVDPYRNCVYIMTGDNDSESNIWIAGDNFKDIKPMLEFGQQSRCCQMQIRKDKILYVTDSESEPNNLYCLKFDENDCLMDREMIADFKGSVIYGCNDDEGENFYFSTTVEPNKGSISTRNVKVYKVDCKLGITVLFGANKDCLPMKLFQYGSVRLKIHGKTILATVCGLRGYDGKTISLKG